jgi:hypothetical protein
VGSCHGAVRVPHLSSSRHSLTARAWFRAALGRRPRDEVGSGSLGGGFIYATPGASTATIVLGVNNYGGIGAESGPPSGYLVLQGATASPVSLVTTNTCYCFGPLPYFDQFSLDWTVDYQGTPYVPTSSDAIPEPLNVGDAGVRLRGPKPCMLAAGQGARSGGLRIGFSDRPSDAPRSSPVQARRTRSASKSARVLSAQCRLSSAASKSGRRLRARRQS